MADRRPIVRIGLPYATSGRLLQEVRQLGAPTLISAGALFRRGRFTRIGVAAWRSPAALDSAGFTAMVQGGYRWSVADYVAFVVTNAGDGELPFPWSWWSAMDYCCEPEIAADRAEVARRMALTVETYADTLAELEWWRGEGVNDVPDPLPIVQGRTAADYLSTARDLASVCPGAQLPGLVGVGSVCRRELHGPEGLITILDALDRELPPGVRLHLFGVKGALLGHLRRWGDRVASVDSMAWDLHARRSARRENRRNDVENRALCMRSWYLRQQAAIARGPAQGDLFS